jgi:hypothetical protein
MASNTSTAPVNFPLRRKEYVAEVAGSVGFAITRYSFNPGLTTTLPWGGTIAPSFEEYDSVMVALHYEPESSTSATGTVMMGFDYDAADVTPATKQELLTFADNVRAAPWVPCTLVLKASDLRKRGRLYTRSGTVSGTDIKTYDLGNAYIATFGQASTAVIGEFWISYHVNLVTPQPSSAILNQSAKLLGNGSITKSAVLGTDPTITGSLNVTASTNTVTFASGGQFLVSYQMTGTGITGTAPTVSASTASVILLNLDGAFATATTASGALLVNAVMGQTLVFDWSAVATTISASSLRIAPYLYSLA